MVRIGGNDRPYVAVRTQKGKKYYYFRKKNKFTRLPDNPDSQQFDNEYWAIRSGRKSRSIKTTFNALIESYYNSPNYKRLSMGTKKNYRRALELIRENNATKDFTRLRVRDVIAARDTYADKWRKANTMVEMISILARHAIQLEWITSNPAAYVEKLKGGEYLPWPEKIQEDFTRYCAETKSDIALTAYHLCTGTGQRIGDVVKMRWDQFDGDFMHVVQEKTNAQVTIYCPAKLRRYLSTIPRKGDHIFAKNLRQHVGKRQVQDAVMKVREAINARHLVIHGWRYTAAVELAEAGCSDTEIQSVTGHKSLAMVQKYRSKANQKRTSKQAQLRREQSKNKL